MKPLFFVLFLFSCGSAESEADYPVTCEGEGDYEYADVVVRADGTVQSPSAVNVPENAVNGVRGSTGGSKDVLSRGFESENNAVVLRWSNRRVENVPGDDFVIFENPFEFGGGVFMDLIVVSVSIDGKAFVPFPYDYLAADETVYESKPELWSGFAGRTPVSYSSNDTTCSDPMESAVGGDRFDLDDLGESGLARRVRNEGFKFLRLQSAPSIVNPETDAPFVRDAISDGFDLDGVYARSTRPE